VRDGGQPHSQITHSAGNGNPKPVILPISNYTTATYYKFILK
jgi:hypothetical protein